MSAPDNETAPAAPVPSNDTADGTISVEQQSALDRALFQTLLISAGVGLLAYLLFIFLRPRVKYLYQPWIEKYGSTLTVKPIASGWWRAFWGWAQNAFFVDERDFIKTHGLDVVLYFNVMRSLLILICGFLIFGLLVLIPVDATATRQFFADEQGNRTSGTAIIAMGNIDVLNPVDSNRYIAHGISVVYNSIWCYIVFYQLYHKIITLQLIAKNDRTRPQNYTVRFVNVDGKHSIEHLKSYFELLFPDEVLAVHRAVKAGKLRTWKKQRNFFVEKREEAVVDNQKLAKKHYKTHSEDDSTPPRTMVRDLPIEQIVSCFSPIFCCTKKVDAEEYWNKKIKQVEDKITNTDISSLAPTGVVYVTFKTIKAARMCSQLVYSQVILDHSKSSPEDSSRNLRKIVRYPSALKLAVTIQMPESWKARPAPEPRDVWWRHHTIIPQSRTVRAWIVGVISAFLVLFYTIPVAFAASLANLTTLASVPFLTWLYDLNNIPFLKALIEGLLPTLVIIIFFELLYLILKILYNHKGNLSYERRHRDLLVTFFWFQIINVFLASLLAGTFLGIVNSLYELTLSPTDLLVLLGRNIPNQVNFFINYIAINSIMRHFLALFRPAQYLVYILKKFLCTKTARQKEMLHRPLEFDYVESLSVDLLVFTIILCYSSIATLVLVFGLIYFLLANLSARYNLVYAYKQPHESWAKKWTTVFALLMSGLLLYQITLSGVFLINVLLTKESPVFISMSVLSLLMAATTLVFWKWCNYKFEALGKFGALGQPLLIDETIDSASPGVRADTKDSTTKKRPPLIEVEGGELAESKEKQSEASSDEEGGAVEVDADAKSSKEKADKKADIASDEVVRKPSRRKELKDWTASTVEPIQAEQIFKGGSASKQDEVGRTGSGSSGSSGNEATPLKKNGSKHKDKKPTKKKEKKKIKSREHFDEPSQADYIMGKKVYNEKALALAYQDPALKLEDLDEEVLAEPISVV